MFDLKAFGDEKLGPHHKYTLLLQINNKGDSRTKNDIVDTRRKLETFRELWKLL